MSYVKLMEASKNLAEFEDAHPELFVYETISKWFGLKKTTQLVPLFKLVALRKVKPEIADEWVSLKWQARCELELLNRG